MGVEHKLLFLVWAFSFFMVLYNDVVGGTVTAALLIINLLLSESLSLSIPDAEGCYALD